MMNCLVENYVSAEGLNNALKVAKTLIEQGYQVMIQYDDCDIYVIAYADNNAAEYGSSRFALITDFEEDMILASRDTVKDKQAKERVQSMIDRGELDETEFNFGGNYEDEDAYDEDEDVSDEDEDDYDEDEDDYYNDYNPLDEEDDRECGRDEE